MKRLSTIMVLVAALTVSATTPVAAIVGSSTPCQEVVPGDYGTKYCGASKIYPEKTCAPGKAYKVTLQAKGFSPDPTDIVLFDYRTVSMYSPFARSHSSADKIIRADGRWKNIRSKRHPDGSAHITSASGSVMQVYWEAGVTSLQLRLWGRCVNDPNYDPGGPF